jgi:hypothetical protein
MGRKHITPEGDEKRVAERLRNSYGDKIENQEDLKTSFEKLSLEKEKDWSPAKQDFFSRVTKEYSKNFELAGVIKEQKRFGREKELKEVIKEQERFGAVPRERAVYDTVGKKKGKVVYSYRQNVVIKGKIAVRYRDARGQFVSVKK